MKYEARPLNESDRSRLLLDVGQAIVSSLNLHELFKTISNSLRSFINHDAATVVLLDQETGELRVHLLDRPPMDILSEGTVIPMEGTPAGLCISTRKTILRDRIDFEEFHVPQMRLAYAAGLRCGCSVPLISHDQVLGSINVGAFREEAFTPEDAELLEQIARPVAIAVENTLNFQRAERERIRAQTLLEINNAITTTLDLDELIHGTSRCLRDYFQHDFAGVSLHDEETDQLMVHSIDLAQPDKYLVAGNFFPIEGTLTGRAFKSRKPVVTNRFDPSQTTWPLAKKFYDEHGLRSMAFIPMIWRERTVGVLNLGSRRENAFSDSNVELLTHIAGQIAIAFQNNQSCCACCRNMSLNGSGVRGRSKPTRV